MSKTYLALGDSYTIGQSVPVAERFPNQTASLLLLDGIKLSTPEIIAQTGWTTGDLIVSINSTPPLKSNYDIVTLLIGVNNQYRHLSQTQYRDEFTILLNKSIVYAGYRKNRVFVLSIPDYSVTPFASGYPTALIASEIDSFNVINKQLALSAGCSYLDITASSRQALNDPALIASDGLHPSGKEYKKWAMLLAPLIKASLQ
ncbi:MAG: SGNH/GDSL hydrolase family protein [Ferruginibacter sp.]|nr:SGNH/GDSL hydrolase family protein [Ferruginibacter sp.]